MFSNVLNSSCGEDKIPVLKLIDFGLSKQWQPPGSSNCIQVRKMNTIVGTLDTAAPEVRDRNLMYTSKCDMWSLGAVAYVIFRRFFETITHLSIYNNISPFCGNKNVEIILKMSRTVPQMRNSNCALKQVQTNQRKISVPGKRSK